MQYAKCRRYIIKDFKSWCRRNGINHPANEAHAYTFWKNATASRSLPLEIHCGHSEFIQWDRVRFWLINDNLVEPDPPPIVSR